VDYYNSVVSLTDAGSGAYRKRHLVPFGEFIPPGFGWVLRVLHIPMSDFARGAAGQPPLKAAGIPLGVAICYEDIFGEEVIDHLPQAQILVNVSNDAWFGPLARGRAAPAGLADARARDRAMDGAFDQHGRLGRDRRARQGGLTRCRLHRGTLVEKVQPRAA
jgi:apolipoprotein N-acyltransferase